MPFDPRVHVGVGAIIIRPDTGKILLIKRRGAHGAGTWGLPGGWIDYGEEPEEAVKRELKEELNIDCEPWHAWQIGISSHIFEPPVDHTITLIHQVPYSFSAQAAIIMEPEKISEIGWWGSYDLKDLNLFPPFHSFWNSEQIANIQWS